MPRFPVLAIVTLAIGLAFPAAAADRVSSTPGALEVVGEDGTVVEMPLRHTDVRVEITAFVARTVVEQTFANPFDEPVEAVYTFPLGDTAAVDDYEITIGSRTIRGEIHRREEARRIYEDARAIGYRAALLEQERPNIFTQSVANLEPGAEIVVRLRTVEVVPYEAGVYRYTFPLVVGPRYVPGGAATMNAAGTATGPVGSTPAVPDAPAITPPVLAPGFRSGHDVDIVVALDAGVPVRSLTSPSHRVASTVDGGRGRTRLLDGDRIPNKDFILEWNVASNEPALGLLAHREGVDGFFTLLVQPKGAIEADEAMPKEIVFVFDTSGSMSGIPLDLSRRFARQALRTLGPDDTFNLVRFAGGAEVYSKIPLDNTPSEVERAVAWIDGLRGGGGTEMLSAFRTIMERPADPDRIRMVIFLTDGYIGNERQIFAAVEKAVGEARIFSLGIGSSVNHYLLRGMADIGRGAYTFVPGENGGEEAVDRFRSWVSRPYITDIEIDWSSLPVLDLLPEVPRDLYSGQTLTVVGRYAGGGEGEVTVRGRLGGRYWEQTVHVSLPDTESANGSLASVWARHRIREIMQSSPGEVTDAMRAEVTALALEYRLMSRFTSFVAVDDSRVVNPGGDGQTVRQAIPIPDGVSFEGVFGPHGPPATWAEGWTPPEMDRSGDEDGPTMILHHYVNDVYVASEVVAEKGIVGRSSRRYEAKRASTAPPSPAAFAEDFVQERPAPGRSYQNVVTLAPGVSAERDTGTRVFPATERQVVQASLRVLADLADDGVLSSAEGRPGLAAILGTQDQDGLVASDPAAHVVAAWALAEAAAALPDDPWIAAAAEKALSRLDRSRAASALRRLADVSLDADGAARVRNDLLDSILRSDVGDVAEGAEVRRLRDAIGSGNLKLAG
jgi:Ca-activated chloride channel family protein